MTSRTFTISTVVAAILASSGAAAQEADPVTGFYVGGAFTQAQFDSGDFSFEDMDDKDNSWKAIAGMRMNRNFGVEANYINFGTSTAPSVSESGPFKADADGFAVFALGMMPAGPADFYLKAGIARIDAKGNAGAVLFKDKATELAYGAGVQWRLGSFALRAEYEKYDTDVIGDLDLISVGFTYNFGSY